MHIFGLGLHVLIALYFGIHALRTGREFYWLFILFAFPLLGSLVYGLGVWLPEMRGSRTLRTVQRTASGLLNPGRELREARLALEQTPSAGSHLRLADALLAAGQAEASLAHYAQARQGVQADEPEIAVRHAQALLESGDAAGARELLDALIQRRPDFRSARGHLVYARAVAASGDRAKAREEFEAVIQGFAGLEARARYAEALLDWAELSEAASLAEESLSSAQRMPAHARELNGEWIRRLKLVAARARRS
jgi:hypothetical protein